MGFNFKKLYDNMGDNIERGVGRAEREVRQAYEDDIATGATRNKVKAYIDREQEILRGNKARRSKDSENLIGGWR